MNLEQTSQDRRGQDQQMAQPAAPAKPAAPAAPKARAPGLRGRCWWLMRELGNFTINRLLETYADGTEKDAHNNLRHYLLQLESYGVVERLDHRQPSALLGSGRNGYVVWRLKRNLGLLAPVWRRKQEVLWDPNRCQVVAPLAAPKEQASSVTSETGFENDGSN